MTYFMCLQGVGIKVAVLLVGLWLTGAQTFAAEVCCSQMPAPKATCGECGGSERESSPRPDCCTSLETQKDIDAVIPRHDLPEQPVVFLTEDTSFSPWRPEATDLVVLRSARAEGPPLYLRYEVLLI